MYEWMFLATDFLFDELKLQFAEREQLHFGRKFGSFPSTAKSEIYIS